MVCYSGTVGTAKLHGVAERSSPLVPRAGRATTLSCTKKVFAARLMGVIVSRRGTMIYVFAGNYREYREFCREHEIRPGSGAYYVGHEDHIRGIRLQVGDVRFLYGTYYFRPTREQVELNEHWRRLVAYLGQPGAVSTRDLTRCRPRHEPPTGRLSTRRPLEQTVPRNLLTNQDFEDHDHRLDATRYALCLEVQREPLPLWRDYNTSPDAMRVSRQADEEVEEWNKFLADTKQRRIKRTT